MDKETIIGIVASVLTAVAMLPELIRLIRARNPDPVSWWVPALLLLGVGGWVWYGFLKDDWIIIGSNAFSWGVNAWILVLSLKYGGKKQKG